MLTIGIGVGVLVKHYYTLRPLPPFYGGLRILLCIKKLHISGAVSVGYRRVSVSYPRHFAYISDFYSYFCENPILSATLPIYQRL